MALDAPVIDTLRYADNLKQSGIRPGYADAMSRSLNIELSHRMLTKADLSDAVDAMGQRLDAVEQRLDAVELRLDAMERQFNRRFEEVDRRFEALEKAVDIRFKVMMSTLLFGFTLLTALGLFNAVPKLAADAPASSPQPAATVEQPANR